MKTGIRVNELNELSRIRRIRNDVFIRVHSRHSLTSWFFFVALAVLSFTGCKTESTSEHEHQWYDWKVTKAATCLATGTRTRTCVFDSTHVETEVIPIDKAHGHDWQDWGDAEVTQQPTCTAAGNGTRTCRRNGCEDIDGGDGKIPALGHDYQNWTNKTATCTAAGEEEGTCTRDSSHQTTRPKAALGHDYTWARTTEPTCASAGEESAVCKRVQSHTGTRPIAINPDAHNWNAWGANIPATESTDSYKTRTCSYNSAHKESEFTGVYATGPAGLLFTLNNNAAYSVSKGTVTSGKVHIPPYYRPDANSEYLPVTTIAPNAFQSASGITGVYISANIRNVGANAFSGCTNLRDITIDNNVYSVSSTANWGHIFPADNLSVTCKSTIPDYAFYNCYRLTAITVLDSVQKIGTHAFYFCRNIKSVTIDNTIIDPFYLGTHGSWGDLIPDTDFDSCVFIFKSNVAAKAFYGRGQGFDDNGKKVTKVIIEDGVTSIGDEAFAACEVLPAFTLPESIKNIGMRAFYYTIKFSAITIPAGVTTVGFSAFAGWGSSQTIYVKGHANRASADAAWEENWRYGCNAVIKYWNGSSYE